MAFEFGATRLNRLTSTSVLTAADPRPCTIAFWIKMATTGDREFGASQWVYENTHGSGGSNFSISISWWVNENYLRMYTNGTHYASGAWTPTTEWQSLAVSFATGTPGAVAFYRNGAALGTTTATFGGTPITASATIGGFATVASGLDPSNDAHYHTALGHNIDGSLGEMVLWNVVLTPAEAQAYTSGASAQQTRPSAIRCHMPFTADVTQDRYRGPVWTAQGTNAKSADHPRILLPTGPRLLRRGTATPPATTGTGSFTFPPLVGDAAGLHGFGGTAAGSISAISGASSATHVPFIGAATGTIAPLTSSATAVHGVAGTASGTIAPLVGDAQGGALTSLVAVGAASNTATTATYTPIPSALLLGFVGASHASGAPAKPTISDTASLVWTEVADVINGTVRETLYKATAEISPAARTSTVASTAAASVAMRIVQLQPGWRIRSIAGTPNVATGSNAAGDPLVSLNDNANPGNYVVGGAFFLGSANVTAGGGYTEMGETLAASTSLLQTQFALAA